MGVGQRHDFDVTSIGVETSRIHHFQWTEVTGRGADFLSDDLGTFKVFYRFKVRIGTFEDGGLVVIARDTGEWDGVGFFLEYHVFGWAGEQYIQVVVL